MNMKNKRRSTKIQGIIKLECISENGYIKNLDVIQAIAYAAIAYPKRGLTPQSSR
jgi:hypothetical protein